jgi:hypothetical protein
MQMRQQCKGVIATGFISCAAFGHPFSAYAGIIYYQNPPPGNEGHYGWMWNPDDRIQNWLDVTVAPTDQTNTINFSSVGQLYNGGLDYINFTEAGALVAIEDSSVATLALGFGDPIEGRRLSGFGGHAAEAEEGVQSNFAPGIPAYIGVLTGNGNYGWILAVRGDGDLEDQMSLTAIAWAYETIPGKPLYAGQIPAPDVAIAMAMGAPFALTPRRRRKDSTHHEQHSTPPHAHGCEARSADLAVTAD